MGLGREASPDGLSLASRGREASPMTPILLALPWAGILAFLFLVVRLPRELPPAEALDGARAPSVSIVVPARNEAVNIEACLTSLVASSYPDFDVVVVDDRSDDETAALARAVPPGNAKRVLVVAGEELPEGWLGKPWACWQGAKAASGDVLLFTDADTTHGEDLLSRAVAGLREENADLLTVLGRQLMDSFWERLVQPQIFLTMIFRYPDFERSARNDRWRDAIANGQFIMMPRASYDAVGGHESVRGQVVEDLALAQVVKRHGRALRIRMAAEDLDTRMYRSLRGLIEGWSKNIVMGGLQSVAPRLRPVLAPVSLVIGVGLWVAPPVALIAAAAGAGGSALLVWSALVYVLSVCVHGVFTHFMGGPAHYALLYPLGSVVGVYIMLRSWIRGRHVEWKGRRYTLPSASELP